MCVSREVPTQIFVCGRSHPQTSTPMIPTVITCACACTHTHTRTHTHTHTHTTCTHTDPDVHRGVLQGHSDAIWDLAVHSKLGLLLSCAADGTCRLWNHTQTSPQVKLFQAEPGIQESVFSLYSFSSFSCSLPQSLTLSFSLSLPLPLSPCIHLTLPPSPSLPHSPPSSPPSLSCRLSMSDVSGLPR